MLLVMVVFLLLELSSKIELSILYVKE